MAHLTWSCLVEGAPLVVDGVQHGGDTPLPEIVRSATPGARLMVDDAHSLGVLADGRGTAAHFGITDQVDLVMGTFSKAFASIGGVVVGDADVIDYVRHTARSLIFSASMPPAQVAAVRAALQIIKEEPERTERVMQIGERMRQGYKELGFEVGDSQTPIVPVFIRDDLKTFGFWKALFQAGIYVNPIVPPAVPPEASLLRTSYMATHTDQQLDRVLDTFGRVASNWASSSPLGAPAPLAAAPVAAADRPHRPHDSPRGQLLDGRQQHVGVAPHPPTALSRAPAAT